MPAWAAALLSVFGLSLVSLAGALTLSLKKGRLERVIFLLVSFAVGAMLGGALLHLIPESYEAFGGGPETGLLVLAGVLSFFVLEKFLHWRHQHGAPEAIAGATGHAHHPAHGAPGGAAGSAEGGAAPFALVALAGSVAHNLIDGAVVAAAYLVSIPTGVVTTLAVMLHEIPQEIGNFGVLVYGGYAPRKALLYNFAAGLVGLVGAGLVLLLGSRVDGLADGLLPVTAGAFLYIAGSDLIPELNRRHSYPASKAVGQLVMMVLGIALMALPLVWE
ncbi:ZIP family metal transporter [Rubrivirga sp. S365]|uniref:ZIP family metal transporter n=1 Tax=Rubrivirga litoralis TaxID=3075598 RepID=A0ABU3BS20_9BACT|nr:MULTISPECIES: ZIP family metal transporter [unclassified Rubrivirga]MDT0632083.1 ZIP family metal transporter [Rubrivirga sp. F394]MDT7856161.1 ZIP family metal transporter [Rubrivirga sp. S365]